jgi:hypothetical protein
MTRMGVAAGNRVTIVTAALLLLFGAGCGAFGARGEAPARQLLADSLKHLSQAATYTVDGRAARGDANYSVAMDVNGIDGHGSVMVGGNTVEVTKAKGAYLIRGYPYLRTVSPNADYIGNDWVLWSNNDMSRLLDQLSDPALLSAALSPEGPSLKRSNDVLFGTDAVKLTNDAVTVWVTADPPVRPLRLETQPDHQLGYFKDVKVNFSKINEPVVVEPVSIWVDPSNWDTMRPFFKVQAETYEYQDCDSGGCGISVSAKNFGGARGNTSFEFTFAKDGGGDLGTCSGLVPVTSNGGTARIGCRIETDEWKEYYKSGTQTGFGATIKITSDQ